MSTTFKVRPGDTLDSVSRRTYGTEAEQGRIARANPDVTGPLSPGTTINTPADPSAPVNKLQRALSSTLDETALMVDGVRFRFWDRISIRRSIDSLDVIDFGGPFDHEAPGFRSTFRPFSFKPMTVTVGGDPLFTGTMVDPRPSVSESGKTIIVSGYSTPGALNDCTPPASAFPLEFNGVNLQSIAQALTGPFGLSVEFQAQVGPVFERVACDPGKTVLAFLTELAQQRGLIISSDERGVLVFRQEVETGAPVARLTQGVSPVMAVEPVFSPQQYFSHVTGIEPVAVGASGAQYTVKNPLLQGAVRPLNFLVPDAEGADVKIAAEAKLGRMFGNVAAYTVRVATWRDDAGALWAPNSTLTLLAPDAMVYREYEFLIRSVTFEQDGRARTATLDITLPGAFRGTIPEALPWDE